MALCCWVDRFRNVTCFWTTILLNRWQWVTSCRVDVHVQGDSLVYQVQKQIKELGDKVPAETVSKVEEKVKELEEALKGEDTDKIKVCFSG
jgi:Hsp70 protein